MKLKKFNELCNKIISESTISESYAILLPGHLFAPVKPFHITKDMLVGPGFCFVGEDTYAGRVKDILSNNEIIYEVSGNYSKRLVPTFDEKVPYAQQGYNGIRCKSFLIKYKLEPGEHYYVCDKSNPPYETGEWCEVIYQTPEPNEDVETEDGEGCACVVGGGESNGAGITTNSVFGNGNSAGDSVVHSKKDPNGPGITTADMKAMYTLSLNPKTKKPKKNYPIFKRIKNYSLDL